MKKTSAKKTVGGTSGGGMSAGVSDGLSSHSTFNSSSAGPSYTEKTVRPKAPSATSVSKGGKDFTIE